MKMFGKVIICTAGILVAGFLLGTGAAVMSGLKVDIPFIGGSVKKDAESPECIEAKEKYEHWVTVGTDETMKYHYLGKMEKECGNKTTDQSNKVVMSKDEKQAEQQEKDQVEEVKTPAVETTQEAQTTEDNKTAQVKAKEEAAKQESEPKYCGSPEAQITCDHVKQEWENEQKIEQQQKEQLEEVNNRQLSQDVANQLVIGTNFMKYDSLLPLPVDVQSGIDGTSIYIYKQGNKQLRMTVAATDRITNVSYTE
ncbi:Secreted protein [Bacillus sp. IT-79MI2]|uniref:Uncharacterized protein n=2 Tax=Bacillaceae TaxID=186817 RepID=A0A1Y3MFV0_9BACI|nr:hypothetical protein BW425_25965 [Bacillus pseudomycoides]PEL26688.1 hypothetical protein CN608_13315 [Bacillus pseudomycoides]